MQFTHTMCTNLYTLTLMTYSAWCSDDHIASVFACALPKPIASVSLFSIQNRSQHWMSGHNSLPPSKQPCFSTQRLTWRFVHEQIGSFSSSYISTSYCLSSWLIVLVFDSWSSSHHAAWLHSSQRCILCHMSAFSMPITHYQEFTHECHPLHKLLSWYLVCNFYYSLSCLSS